MEHRHQPRHGLRECQPWQPTAWQSFSKKVPAVTTLILPCNATEPQDSCLHRSVLRVGNFARLIGVAFAFLQMNLLRDCYLRTQQISRRHTTRRNYVKTCCMGLLSNISHVAVARTICRAGTKSARPSIAPSSEPQCGLTLTEPFLPWFHGSTRRFEFIWR